jgi:hypothetical protein
MDIIINDERIEALMAEAAAAGDMEMVRICERAIEGDDDAIAECARVIRDAAAVA